MNVFMIFSGSRKRQCGMGCKARRAANSPCYWQASQRRRPPAMALALRVGAKSGDFFGHPLAWALAHAARMTFELIPIATQRDPEKTINTF